MNRLQRLLLAGAVVSLVGMAAACSDDDSSSSSPTTAAATTAAGAATTAAAGGSTTAAAPTTRDPNAPLDKVRLSAVTRANAGNWFMVAGIEQGIFKKWGIEVEITTNPSSVAALAALLGGSGDFAPPTYDAGLQAQIQAPDLKWVANGYNRFTYELVVPPEITSVEQLRGKSCGVSALTTADGLATQLMLRDAAGMAVDKDYKLISIGTSSIATRLAALESGQAQCVTVVPPDVQAYHDAGYKTLLEARNVKAFDGLPFFGYVASKEWYDDPKNRDIAERFLAGMSESIVWLYDPANKAAAVDILARNAQLEPRLAEAAYKWIELGGHRADLKVEASELQKTVDAAQSVGVLPLFNREPSDFIDNSLNEAAIARLDPATQAKVKELVQKFQGAD
jgi:hypothetical protein